MYDRNLVLESVKELVGYSPDLGREVTGDLVAGDPLSQVDKKHPLITHTNNEAIKPRLESYPDFLQRVRQESILEAVQDLFDYKSVNQSVKQLISDVKGIFGDKLTFDQAAFIGTGFVGHRIKALRNSSRAVIINRLGLNLLNPQDVTLYIFRGEDFTRENAFATIPVSYTGNGTYKWFDVDQRLTFVEDNEAYYFGFFEEDLGAEGNTYMTRPFDFAKSCGSCNVYDANRFRTWNPFIGIFPVTADPLTGEVTGTNKKTYGINLGFSIECDVTAILLTQRRQIARLAIEKMVIRHLSELVNSVEIGKIPDRTRALAEMAIQGSFTPSGSYIKGTGLLEKYRSVIEKTSFEFSGIGNDCLKCDKSHGILRWT